ncbi:MAG: dipeptidase, partial [Chlamydiia bacterium]|nr:dipeptidase [Chlamydiia bacterium]
MEPSVAKLKKAIQDRKTQAQKEYFHFLSIPSISSEKAYKKETLSAANWVKEQMHALQLQPEVWAGKGHPTLFGCDLSAGKDKPTLLIYNHYDVQPVDPLEEWSSDPFTPTIRKGEVYARGASDNKGQLFYVLEALKCVRKLCGTFPINIKWLVEGEEECGSATLSRQLKQHKKQLKADYLVIVDMGIPSLKRPAITLGVRGLTTCELELKCAHSDLHSGMVGGVVPNPLHILSRMLSQLHTPKGKVNIPGFYSGIIPLSKKEKQQLDLPFSNKEFQQKFGILPFGGEENLTGNERGWLRPTLEVNGMWGGYCGDGFKTVIPAKAHAKISCRLVPGQDPKKIQNLLQQKLRKITPKGCTLTFSSHTGLGAAVRISPHSPLVQSLAAAYRDVFSLPCRYILSGGSIPIAAELAQASHADIALIGLSLDDDGFHAPNEHFGLKRLDMGAL